MGDQQFHFGGPEDSAKQDIKITVNNISQGQQDFEELGSASASLDAWLERLVFLQEQEAISSDPIKLFELKKRIEEAKSRIKEFT